MAVTANDSTGQLRFYGYKDSLKACPDSTALERGCLVAPKGLPWLFGILVWNISIVFLSSPVSKPAFSGKRESLLSIRDNLLQIIVLVGARHPAFGPLGFVFLYFSINVLLDFKRVRSCWHAHAYSLRASDWRPWKMGFGIISAGLAYFPLLFLCLTFTQRIVIHDAIGHLSPFCSISDYCFDFPSGVSRVFCLSVR